MPNDIKLIPWNQEQAPPAPPLRPSRKPRCRPPVPTKIKKALLLASHILDNADVPKRGRILKDTKGCYRLYREWMERGCIFRAYVWRDTGL